MPGACVMEWRAGRPGIATGIRPRAEKPTNECKIFRVSRRVRRRIVRTWLNSLTLRGRQTPA